MKRVLYLVEEYPQISETYIKTEIEQVKQRYEVSVACTRPANLPYENHVPYEILRNMSRESLADLVKRHKPDIVHGHYFHMSPMLLALAQEAGTFFTVRTHSFDLLLPQLVNRQNSMHAVNDPRCRGALCFPYGKEIMIRVGVDASKIHPCWPVANIKLFRNRDPNGPDVMNVGAALPKKDMNSFADLARLNPDVRWDLYMLGYNAESIHDYALTTGSPMNVIPPHQPEDMPAEYKKHRWLVYTASRKINTVGWPLAVAEAQASGVGVMIQNIRPDLKEYVGPGGYVFDTAEDVRRIISQPFPEEKREASFAHAEKSDIAKHINLLFDLWQ